MTDLTPLPSSADVIVIGSGSAGAVVAGVLAAPPNGPSILVLEAGPDYGPRHSGRWPDDLLNAAGLATLSHDWGYTGTVRGRQIRFHRAKVLGGCSSHNAGATVHGNRLDYDSWAAAGNPGWSADELRPLFEAAWQRLGTRTVSPDALTPFQQACATALEAVGYPWVEDFNDLDEFIGTGAFPLSVAVDGTRMNTPFAYVDPVRDSPRFTVRGNATVQRLLMDGTRVAGVVVSDGGAEVEVRADRVVLSGGAYGSPAILLRSGIGPAEHLRAVGVPVVHDLPGVGENLHDQPALEVAFAGSDELERMMSAYAADHWCPEEQVLAKFPSSLCPAGFDSHIWPVGGYDVQGSGGWSWTIGAAVLTPDSRGWVRLTGPGADDPLDIDHRYLSDPGARDLARLVETVARVREVAAVPSLAGLLGAETYPGPHVAGVEALTRFVDESAVHYYHPVGTCKMGPSSDPGAVVAADGSLHGLQGLYVADASIMPQTICGNTHMPTVVIGEKIGRTLAGIAADSEPDDR